MRSTYSIKILHLGRERIFPRLQPRAAVKTVKHSFVVV